MRAPGIRAWITAAAFLLAPGYAPAQGPVGGFPVAKGEVAIAPTYAVEHYDTYLGADGAPEDREVTTRSYSLFVEAALPPPPVPWIKLSPTMWGRISRAFWFMGYSPEGVEGHRTARRRVSRIADLLIEEASDGDDVLLCAHGYLNWMFDHHIRKRGWERIVHDGENEYWSYRAYRLAAPRTEAVAQAAPAQTMAE